MVVHSDICGKSIGVCAKRTIGFVSDQILSSECEDCGTYIVVKSLSFGIPIGAAITGFGSIWCRITTQSTVEETRLFLSHRYMLY